MRALFRLDADSTIGLGHLMRSRVLADALRERGVACTFACRPASALDGARDAAWLARRIVEAGHSFEEIGRAGEMLTAREDAELSAALAWRMTHREGLPTRPLTLVVVDHYGLDAPWERALGRHAERVLVIDDLLEREHHCDLLLDSCPGRAASDYAERVPAHCDVMAGERFALIREEITAARGQSLARRRASGFALGRVLVTMGGADAANHSGAALTLLDEVLPPAGIAVDVVLGATCPWIDNVRASAAAMARPVRVLVDIDDMGRVMADSDLAVGAAGATALERCVLGLPSIALVTADNQRHIAAALGERGAVLAADSLDEVRRRLHEWLAEPFDADRANPRLAALGEAAADVCDGHGPQRVLDRLFA